MCFLKLHRNKQFFYYIKTICSSNFVNVLYIAESELKYCFHGFCLFVCLFLRKELNKNHCFVITKIQVPLHQERKTKRNEYKCEIPLTEIPHLRKFSILILPFTLSYVSKLIKVEFSPLRIQSIVLQFLLFDESASCFRSTRYKCTLLHPARSFVRGSSLVQSQHPVNQVVLQDMEVTQHRSI